MSEQIMLNTNKSMNQISYEQAFTKLGEIVNSLEEKELSLEQAISLFEEGQALLNHCADLLNKAELRVQQVLTDEVIDFPIEE